MSFAASQQAFAAALLEPGQEVPPGITCRRGTPDATRFAVYRNNIFVGLTRALARIFPVTERLVGSEFFLAMARAYAQDHKPATPVILDYGADFPDFIAGFEPARPVAYLADVARLEKAWMRAYHAADARPLQVADLASMDPQTLMERRLVAHPSAAIVACAHPAGSIWAAHQHEPVAAVSARGGETMLVARPDMTVNVHILPRHDAAFATALLDGATPGAAAQAALEADDGFDFGRALVGLVTLGAFCAIGQQGEASQ